MATLVRAGRAPTLVLSPADGVGVAARAVLRSYVRAFVVHEAAARTGDVEALHQLRVATRRLRAGLGLLAPVLPAAFGRRADAELAWLATGIGAVRDLDVLGETVRGCARRLDAESRHALGPLALAIHDRRASRHAALVDMVNSPRCRRLLNRLTTFADSPPPRRQAPLGDVAPEMIAPLVRAVTRAGRRVAADSPPPVLHRLRVRAKRLRYALETLQGLGDGSVRKLVRRLERLQELLGRCQDAATGVAWLRAWAAETPGAPATLLATGGLIQVLTRRQRRLRRRFPEAWDRIDRRRLRAGVHAELAVHRRPSRAAVPVETAEAS